MIRPAWTRPLRFLLSDYGMLLVLVALCAFFSLATIQEQHPTGPAAARELAARIAAVRPKPSSTGMWQSVMMRR